MHPAIESIYDRPFLQYYTFNNKEMIINDYNQSDFDIHVEH